MSSGRLRAPDEYVAYFQTESLVTRHTLTTPQGLTIGDYYGIFDRFGQPRAPYPVTQPLLSAPFFLLGRLAVKAVHPPDDVAERSLTAYVTTTVNALAAAAAVTVLFLLLINLGLPYRASLLTALAIAFTTLLWPYAGYFFSEPISTLMVALAALIYFPRADSGELSPRAAALGGLVLAALVWVRVTHVLAAPVFCFALLADQKSPQKYRPVVFIVIAMSISLACYLAYNHHLYGSYFEFGYPYESDGGRKLNSFITPPQLGFFGLLFSPGKSIFMYLPMIIPGLVGLKRLAKHSRGLAVVAGLLPFVYLLFYASYAQWEGGRCLGPRYLLPTLTFLCLGAAPLLAEGKKRLLIYGTFAFGLFVQLVSMATSFLEAVGRHPYYNPDYSYMLSYFHLGQQLRLLWLYATGALPQQPGLGWDRWFVFLHQVGISYRFILPIVAIELALVAMSAWWMVKQFRFTENADRP